MDAAILKHNQAAVTALPAQGANKWEVLRELGVAKMRLGVTDRDLTVLQALLSFYPATLLGGNRADLVVFPSNSALCERLNGMACSTMRRHLANIVRTGLIVRRDSPNGKRYARRRGDSVQAFGFDLSPLVQRYEEFCEIAEAVRAEEDAYRRLRQSVSLMRRDLASLVVYGRERHAGFPHWDRLSDTAVLAARDLRRKLSIGELDALAVTLSVALDEARDCLEAEDMSTKDAQSEQHYQNSKTEVYDLEPCLEKAGATGDVPDAIPPELGPNPDENEDDGVAPNDRLPNLPLPLILSVCAEIQDYVPDKIRHWHHLVQAAERIRPMMGISPSAWDAACDAMGHAEAAVVVAAMLERFSDIHSPGGYLRRLTQKAENNSFSCGPMVMALQRRQAA